LLCLNHLQLRIYFFFYLLQDSFFQIWLILLTSKDLRLMLLSVNLVVFIKKRRRSIFVSLASQKRRLETSILLSLLHFWICGCLILLKLMLASLLKNILRTTFLWICFEARSTKLQFLPYFGFLPILDPNIDPVFGTLVTIETSEVIGMTPVIIFFL
jgi:hypothetical protein